MYLLWVWHQWVMDAIFGGFSAWFSNRLAFKTVAFSNTLVSQLILVKACTLHGFEGVLFLVTTFFNVNNEMAAK
jgi:hypothetical protein